MEIGGTYESLQRRLAAEAAVHAKHLHEDPGIPRQAAPRPRPTPPVAVAVDQAGSCAAAVGWAVREATDRAAPLLLLAADDGHRVLSQVDERHVRHEVADLLVRLQAEHPDLPVDAQVATEKAGPFLVSATAHAQLLVLGSRRDHGLLGQRLLATTSAYCLAHATCPVVVVPEAWREPQAPDLAASGAADGR